jgi:4,5-DOPA dioxygenase extradiol
VLLLGSGNVVHNLSAYAWGSPETPPAAWAVEFESAIRGSLSRGEDEVLLDPGSLGLAYRMAVPTPEHYLPLPVILGTRWPEERAEIVVEGFEGGSLSMLSLRFGGHE